MRKSANLVITILYKISQNKNVYHKMY
jgi:hypothetical protein